MVTGVYYPEISGASLQCRTLVAALGDRVRCCVLTTTSSRTLPRKAEVDGVPIQRVIVDLDRPLTKIMSAVAMSWTFVRDSPQFEIVHLHGFSQKSILLMLLARILGKRVVVKMSSVGHDDPIGLRRRHPLLYAMFSRADRFISISPAFADRYREADLPGARLVSIPNGVDLIRFSPAAAELRQAVRHELGWPDNVVVILCVGFFSGEKQQQVLFDAWVESRAATADTALTFVGATGSTNSEVDPSIAVRLLASARALGLAARFHLIEKRLDIERVYQAADVFVLPSTREGAPNVVLEAMASALPCIVSRLPGVTDALIEDGQNGVLVEPGDRQALAAAITAVVRDPALARRLGANARTAVARRFAIDRVANEHIDMYRSLLQNREPRTPNPEPGTRRCAE